MKNQALLLILTALVGYFSTAHADSTVVIGAVGDVMMGSDFKNPNLPDDPGELWDDPRPILRGVDIAFGNFEGTFGTGGQTAKSGPNQHAFRTPPDYARHLAEAGFDVMSLANNHAMDFGSQGLKETKTALEGENIRYSARDGGIAVVEVNGLRVGFLAAGTHGGTRNINDGDKVIDEIKAHASLYDIFVVSVHAGAEGSDKTHVPFEEESFHEENRGDVVAFGHAAIDSGADLILMHGPHVPRALEVYKDRLLAYSLGNFYTYGKFGLSGVLGYAPLLEVELDQEGRLIAGQVHSFFQKKPGGPLLDEAKKRAALLIQELSEEDFPNTAPKFDGRGGFVPGLPVEIHRD